MPLYDYQCAACGKIEEIRHGFNESPGRGCAACGGELVRKFHAAPIVFKGSGFYVTDSRSSGADKSEPKPEKKTDGAPAAADAAKPAETPKSESPKKDAAA